MTRHACSHISHTRSLIDDQHAPPHRTTITARTHSQNTQYDPAPPTPLGQMPAAVNERVRGAGADLLERRWAAVRRIQCRLGMAVE